MQYPEWQKPLRAAQEKYHAAAAEKQRQADEAQRAKDQADGQNLETALAMLGIILPATPTSNIVDFEGFKFRLRYFSFDATSLDFRFSLTVSAIYPDDVALDDYWPYEFREVGNWGSSTPRKHVDGDWSREQADLADALDWLTAYRDQEYAIFKARQASGLKAMPEYPTATERLITALRDLIDEKISQRLDQ